MASLLQRPCWKRAGRGAPRAFEQEEGQACPPVQQGVPVRRTAQQTGPGRRRGAHCRPLRVPPLPRKCSGTTGTCRAARGQLHPHVRLRTSYGASQQARQLLKMPDSLTASSLQDQPGGAAPSAEPRGPGRLAADTQGKGCVCYVL